MSDWVREYYDEVDARNASGVAAHFTEDGAKLVQDRAHRELVTRFVAAVDTLEVDRLIPFFAPDATFTYANNLPMVGHDGIRAGLEPFHASIAAISHRIRNCFPSGPNVIVAEYEVSYTRLDGQVVTLPAISVFELSDGLISVYRVYVDIAPVFASAAG